MEKSELIEVLRRAIGGMGELDPGRRVLRRVIHELKFPPPKPAKPALRVDALMDFLAGQRTIAMNRRDASYHREHGADVSFYAGMVVAYKTVQEFMEEGGA